MNTKPKEVKTRKKKSLKFKIQQNGKAADKTQMQRVSQRRAEEISQNTAHGDKRRQSKSKHKRQRIKKFK